MIHIKPKKGAPYFTADPVEVPSSGVGADDLQRSFPGSTMDSWAHFMVPCAAGPSSPCFQHIKASSQAE